MNDPELNGKYLGTITKDFVVVAETIKEASYQVRKQDFSEYPIFPISREMLPIGNLLLAKEDIATEWNYFITYMDEFVQRGLIDLEKVEDFKATYKNPDEFCCLFATAIDIFRNFLQLHLKIWLFCYLCFGV